jgi:acyl-CoA reductase-like NAD-dependent aldehyde dehydrogenase
MNTERINVTKTYKLYINGKFPRSESGRSLKIEGAGGEVIAHLCHASRKDMRDAVEVARAAQEAWAGRAAYNRGQILYRMAEMMEGKHGEFVEVLEGTKARRNGGTKGKKKTTTKVSARGQSAAAEIDACIDRLVCFAGWADKFAQVLGCHNPVAGPYYNFTVPEPSGVVAVVAPDEPALLGLVSLIAPAVCAGNTVVAIASERHPIAAAVFGEVCATSDVPPGVINIITGQRAELVEPIAQHRGIDAVLAANLPKSQATTLRLGAAENVKRVHVKKLTPAQWYDADATESPWTIEPLIEMKTIWHPSGV